MSPRFSRTIGRMRGSLAAYRLDCLARLPSVEPSSTIRNSRSVNVWPSTLDRLGEEALAVVDAHRDRDRRGAHCYKDLLRGSWLCSSRFL